MRPKPFQRSQIPQQHLQTFRHVACIIVMSRTKGNIDLLTYLLSFFIHTTLLMSQISTLSVQFYSLAGWQEQALVTTEPYITMSTTCLAYNLAYSIHKMLKNSFQFSFIYKAPNTFPTEHDHPLHSIATRELNMAPTVILKLAKLSVRHNYISVQSIT